MALYGSFDKTRHFAELADNATDQHGNLLTPTVRRNTAFQNLTGDGSITAAEVAQLSGSSPTAPAASTTAILDSGGDLRTASNVGTSAATSVIEYGDGFNHTTVLTCTALATPDVADNAASAVGDLIYTFPAGAIILESAYFNIALTLDDSTKTDTPDVGLGTVIGTGSEPTLDTTAEFEDILTGQTATDVNGTATVTAAVPTNGAPLFIASGDAHTVHVNAADTWANTTTQGLVYTGTVVLNWKFME